MFTENNDLEYLNTSHTGQQEKKYDINKVNYQSQEKWYVKLNSIYTKLFNYLILLNLTVIDSKKGTHVLDKKNETAHAPSVRSEFNDKKTDNLNNIEFETLINKKGPMSAVGQAKGSVTLNNNLIKKGSELNIILSIVHCFLISIITISLIFFMFNPEILLNVISLITNFFLH